MKVNWWEQLTSGLCSGPGPEVDLRWLTADLLILIWIRTITEITAPTWSRAKNRRWISVDLTCLEQPGMSWITMEWSAVVTAATANWVSAAPTAPSDRQETRSSTALRPAEQDAVFKYSFRLYFWSVVVIQFKRNIFRAAQTGVQHEGLINHDSDWQPVHCFNIGTLQFSPFILSHTQTHSSSGQWQSVMWWWRSGSWWSRVTGCWRGLFLSSEGNLGVSEARVVPEKMRRSSGESDGSGRRLKMSH